MAGPLTITFTPSIAVLQKKFRSIDIKEFLRKEIEKLGFLVEGEAKRVTPVDTGRLRSSIVPLTLITGLGVAIRPTVNYAYYVHEGKGSNKNYGRRPFMDIGAEKAVSKYNRDIGKDLNFHIQKRIA